LSEFLVPALCIPAERGDDSTLRGDKSILDDQSKEPLKFGNLPVELLQMLIFNLYQFRGFNGVNVKLGGGLSEKALKVGNPPVFDRKLNDVLIPLPVYIITSQAPVDNKILVPAHFPLFN